MSQVPPPGQEDDEIEGLAILVAENLQEGEDPQVIAQQLVDNGWKEEDAIGFVASIRRQLENQNAPQADGDGMGWLMWIGGVLFINLLSYLFEWGFWIY